MTGRRLSRAAHQMKGEVYVGRPLPARPGVVDAALKDARVRDQIAIEAFKGRIQAENQALGTQRRNI